jgi:glycosyltransferase involved in cell wall biosynthesis
LFEIPQDSFHKVRFLRPKLSVLMPVFNERSTLVEILRRVQAVGVEKEIIIVDNCSTDGTREFLQDMLHRGQAGDADSGSPLRVVLQAENKGKGASVRRALELARGQFVIVQDADLEYDPADYLKLLAVAEGANAEGTKSKSAKSKSAKREKRAYDVVFGTRLLRGTATRAQQPRTSFYYGRVGLSIMLRILYAVPISDVATCYKLLKREVAQSLDLQSSGFDLDFEIAAKVARLKKKRVLRYAEVPVSYSPRTELEGKKIRVWRDGWRAAWALLRFRIGH